MSKKQTTRRPRRPVGRRNRKLKAQGFRLPMRTAVSCVVLVCAGVFYLLLCTRVVAMGQQIRDEERELEQLRRQVAREEVRWNDMLGPRSLQAALQRHNLDMRWPEPHQVVHVRDFQLWLAGQGQPEVLTRMEGVSTAGGSRIQ